MANWCRACEQDFSSVRTFDQHRVGKHEYTYSEGIKFEPMVEDGRRCLTEDEMLLLGLRPDKRGRWCDPTQNPAARLRERHQPTGASL